MNKTRKAIFNHECDRPDLVHVVRMRSSPREDFSIALFHALLFWCLIVHLAIKNSVTMQPKLVITSYHIGTLTLAYLKTIIQ